MKYLFLKGLLVWIIFFCFGCNQNSKHTTTLSSSNISIDSNINIENNIFDFIKEIEAQEIINNDSPHFVLNPVVKAVEYKNDIFLSTSEDEIYHIDSKGNIIKKLYGKGEGPNEYREIRDFNINPNTEELLVYDFQKQRFLVYDLEFKYKRTDFIGLNFMSFSFINKNLILFAAKHRNMLNNVFYDFDLFLVDKDYNIKQTFVPFDSSKYEVTRLHKKNPFFKIQDKIVFNDLISDTVYEIKEEKINVLFNYEYKNTTLSKEFLQLSHSEMLKQFRSSPEKFNEMDFFANLSGYNKDFLISNFSNNNKNIFSFYSFKTGVSKNYEFPSDVVDKEHKRILKPHFSNQSKFVTFVYPYVLEFIKEEYIKKNGNDSFTEKIDSILQNTILDGNQLILKYSMKSF